MAAPITHILLADKFLQTAPQFSPATFIVGTSFPDIRHLGSLSREQTHLGPIDLASIREEPDPFLAGMRFHNYVDIARKAYWEQTTVYKRLPQSEHIQKILKLQEDIVLYDRVRDWNHIASYFRNSLAAEQAYGAPDADIQQWHQMLVNYISQRPSLRACVTFKSQFKAKLNLQTVQEMAELFRIIQTTEGLGQAINELHETFVQSFGTSYHTLSETRQPLLSLVE